MKIQVTNHTDKPLTLSAKDIQQNITSWHRGRRNQHVAAKRASLNTVADAMKKAGAK
jgi:hypothetical protein